MDGQPFHGLHHAGDGNGLSGGPPEARRVAYICLAVFGQARSPAIDRGVWVDRSVPMSGRMGALRKIKFKSANVYIAAHVLYLSKVYS